MTVKTLPNEPGHWACDRGHTFFCNRIMHNGNYRFCGGTPSQSARVASSLADLLTQLNLPPGRWMKMEMPEFPPIPEKPKVGQCLVSLPFGPRHDIRWRTFKENTLHSLDGGVDAHQYRVVPDPRNDPVAIQIIEDARREHEKTPF